MGGKTTTTSTASMDPLQQKYISEYIMPVAGDIKESEFTAYEGDRVADLSDLQKQMLAGYGALNLPSEYTEAGDIYRGVAAMTPEEIAATKTGYAQEYMDAILDPSRARLERQQQQQQVGIEGDLIKRGAFGAGRRGVYEAERDVARDIEMANLEAGIARDAYGAADRRFGQEMGLRTGAAGALAGLGGNIFSTELSRLGSGMAAGEAARSIDQARLDKAYEAYLMANQYPLTKFSALTGGSASFPAGIGTTTGSTYDPMGSFGKIVNAAGNFMYGMNASDVRLKEDIVHEDTLNGVKFYRWKWNKVAEGKGLKGHSYGVIAQELQEIYPHLVGVGPDGYKQVNYGKLYAEIGDRNVIV